MHSIIILNKNNWTNAVSKHVEFIGWIICRDMIKSTKITLKNHITK